MHISSDWVEAIASGAHIDMNELRQDLVGWVVDAIIEDSSGLGTSLLDGWHYFSGNGWNHFPNLVLYDPTDSQRRSFNRAISYLSQSDIFTRDIWGVLRDSGQTITIRFIDEFDGLFVHPLWQVQWNPYAGLRLNDGYVMSPAMVLAHELGHAVQQVEGFADIEYIMSLLITDFAAHNREVLEPDILYRFEGPIARQLGEPTRERYEDAHRRMVEVGTSTDWGHMAWGQGFLSFPIRTFENLNTWSPDVPTTAHAF